MILLDVMTLAHPRFTGSPSRAKNIEALQQAGSMALLRPLLLDNVPRYMRM